MNTHKHSLLLLLFVAISLPLIAQEKKGIDPAALQRVETLLQDSYKDNAPGAVILISQKGKGVFQRAYGMADIESNKTLTADAPFALGSLTGKFVAAAILLLNEEGKVSLQEPAVKYIPDYSMLGQSMTVEHLLTHTSGLAEFVNNPEWIAMCTKETTPYRLLSIVMKKGLLFKPGTDESYSAANYVALALIVEKVSGVSYQEFIQKRIIDKAGLPNTRFIARDENLVSIKGYTVEGTGPSKAPAVHATQCFGYAGLMSTASDLSRFNYALVNGRILKKETLQRAMAAMTLASGKNSTFGYLGRADLNHAQGHPAVVFMGAGVGFRATERYYPEDDVYVLLLTNGASDAMESPYNTAPVSQKVGKLVFGLALSMDEASCTDCHDGKKDGMTGHPSSLRKTTSSLRLE